MQKETPANKHILLRWREVLATCWFPYVCLLLQYLLQSSLSLTHTHSLSVPSNVMIRNISCHKHKPECGVRLGWRRAASSQRDCRGLGRE